MKKRLLFLLIIISFGRWCIAQDTLHVRRIVDTLTSPNMWGRGYVNEGDKRAAKFIAAEFKKGNIQPLGSQYFQNVTFPINTFNQNMEVKVDDSVLVNFYDFRAAPSSKGCTGTFDIVEVPIDKLKTIDKLKKYLQKNHFADKFLFVDVSKIKEQELKSKRYTTALEIIQALEYQDIFEAKGIIIGRNTLHAQGMWSNEPINTTVLNVQRGKLKEAPKRISVNIDNQYYPKYTSQNVIAYLKGAVQPDTFVVIGAHYDHLGCLGLKSFFPGANDNACGAATLVDLANYYANTDHKPYYSLVFLAFAGEETGLLGSTHYVNHPLFPLSNIKVMLNLDLVGTGDEGITMVNATSNPTVFQQFDTLNKGNGYLPKVVSRGEAANSDHHPFHKAGVPAVFIYGMGKSGPYHHVEDNSANLTLKGYLPMFKLLTSFINTYR